MVARRLVPVRYIETLVPIYLVHEKIPPVIVFNTKRQLKFPQANFDFESFRNVYAESLI